MSYSFKIFDPVTQEDSGFLEIHSLSDVAAATYVNVNKSLMTLYLTSGKSFLVRYDDSGQSNEDFLALWGA